MATKEEVLEDFLKSFRISLNFILLYSREHKSFLKSVAELKNKAAALSAFLSPIDIEFTTDSLIIDGQTYSKMSLHRELAAFFHQRKVQRLTITSAVKEEELALLLEKSALAPKEIIKSGGLSQILSASENQAFTVQDLDYSQLLRGEGEEVKDIWTFMLTNAVGRNDLKKINEFADSFDSMIRKFKAREFIEDDELVSKVQVFVGYLKQFDHQKFVNAGRSIMSVLSRDRAILVDGEKIKKLKKLLEGMSAEDYADSLWNEMVTDKNFDLSGFQLFSKLLEEDQHKKVASHLAEKLNSPESLKNSANTSKRIRELFASSKDFSVSEVYLRELDGAGSGNPSYRSDIVFDRQQLGSNYRVVLLNLLSVENDRQRLDAIAGSLLKEWDNIIAEKKPQYLEWLGEAMLKQRDKEPASPAMAELSDKFDVFIESLVWEDNAFPGFSEMFGKMQKSSLGSEFYLKKIFEENNFNIRVLKAFFTFFSAKLPDFFARLQEKRTDIDFVAKIVEVLNAIDSPIVLPVLELVYSFSSDMIKIEILRIMARTREYNRQFILEVLKGEGPFLKKEALAVFSEDGDRKKAMELLFYMPNPWGKNNKIILENLGIVEDAKQVQAKEYLEYLYRNTAFWNFSLKKRIKEVLGRLNA